MEKICGIYKIKSKIIPIRIYIGSSVNIISRWKNHKIELALNKHGNIVLQNHVNMYGIEDLHFTILHRCEEKDLLNNEQYFIDKDNPYFNICRIAKSRLGCKVSDETKKKMSIIVTGHSYFSIYNKTKKGGHLSEEHKRKIGESLLKGHYSRPKNKEWKEKIRQSLLGKYKQPKSEDHKRKIRLSKIGVKRKPFTEIHLKRMSEAQIKRYQNEK